MNYAEFLAENGATPDEIKILDTPAARKGYDKLQAQVAEAAVAKQKADDLYKRNQDWARQVEDQNQNYLKERDTAKIEAAASAAKIAKMQELGLIEVAERMEPGSTKTDPPPNSGPDMSKYVDRDTLMAVAEREGDAIATVQDIAYEHARLFPDKPLNFRELRREAVARKLSVESLWMEKYGVQAARDARAATDKAAYEKKIREDAVTEYKSQHSETNPLTAPYAVSKTPFTNALPSTGKDGVGRQPWQKTDGEKGNERMNKVMGKLHEQGLVQ